MLDSLLCITALTYLDGDFTEGSLSVDPVLAPLSPSSLPQCFPQIALLTHGSLL